MSERIAQEVALLMAAYPEMEWRPHDCWARIARYPVPSTIWTVDSTEVAFQLPAQLPGQAPYGFWVKPDLTLRSGGAINNYSYPVVTPFGPGWGQFSWAPDTWRPGATAREGTSMLDFVRSFADRLREGS